MRVMVTGGAGFIGSNVVDGYMADGHDVVVVDNLYTGKKENLHPNAKFYNLDIRDKALREVFEAEKPAVVSHHAAQISVPASVEDPLFDADVNVIGLLNILEGSVKHGVIKVIFSSSGGAIYGETDMLPTAEDHTLRPHSPYAITKLISEQYLEFYRLHYGLDYTVLRYANVYGPRQVPYGEAGVVAIFMEQLLRGEVPVIYRYGDEPEGMTRDYCFVEDVVRANLIVLDRGTGDIFNIGTGVQTSTAKLYRTILSLMRDEGYAADARYDSPEDGPARPGDLRRSCLSPEKALRQLGWQPDHDLASGLRKTLRWLVGKGLGE
jgi:UDP-glucose 4-epimerase